MLDLTDRQRRILARLVSEYIEQGEPISSSWLANNSGLGLSSATVRNILAHLEDHGFVRQPHTSAGRVPTDSGYRLYVDGLLGARKRTRPAADVEARLRRAGTLGDMLEGVSHELSRASHHVGFALTTTPDVRLAHIDFVNIGDRRVLVIVVSEGGHITHRVVDTDDTPDSTLLTEAANYINAEFAGMTIGEARTAIIARLQQERIVYNALMARALRLARQGLHDVAPVDMLHVQGTSSLLDDVSARDDAITIETLRALFHMIEDRHKLLDLLTRYVGADGLTVVIGSEHALPDLRPFSLVAAVVHDGPRSGTVGVIGPTRMRYQRTISVVDGVSQVVGRVLEGQ